MVGSLVQITFWLAIALTPVCWGLGVFTLVVSRRRRAASLEREGAAGVAGSLPTPRERRALVLAVSLVALVGATLPVIGLITDTGVAAGVAVAAMLAYGLLSVLLVVTLVGLLVDVSGRGRVAGVETVVAYVVALLGVPWAGWYGYALAYWIAALNYKPPF